MLKLNLIFGCFVLSMQFAVDASAQLSPLPDGAQTSWIVDEPEEIITHLAFDPASVSDRLPVALEFITLGQLADRGHQGSREHLEKHPQQADWGVSFLEIVRQTTFEIDGKAPSFSEHGAIGMWFAGVQPADPESTDEPGRLALELWVPDSTYITYMREKGHYATYADVRLHLRADSTWLGTVEADGLRIQGECRPEQDVREAGPGGNVVYPPAPSGIRSVVRTRYAGHKERECEVASWDITGTNPLAETTRLGSSIFSYGYDLRGGAYNQ